MPERKQIIIDTEGFIHVDGVKVARRIERCGEAYLQFFDKCRRRGSERGSPLAEVPAADFDRAVLSGCVPIADFDY